MKQFHLITALFVPLSLFSQVSTETLTGSVADVTASPIGLAAATTAVEERRH